MPEVYLAAALVETLIEDIRRGNTEALAHLAQIRRNPRSSFVVVLAALALGRQPTDIVKGLEKTLSQPASKKYWRKIA